MYASFPAERPRHISFSGHAVQVKAPAAGNVYAGNQTSHQRATTRWPPSREHGLIMADRCNASNHPTPMIPPPCLSLAEETNPPRWTFRFGNSADGFGSDTRPCLLLVAWESAGLGFILLLLLPWVVPRSSLRFPEWWINSQKYFSHTHTHN